MYAMYALRKFHWKPSEFVSLPLREKAATMAMIDEMARREAETYKNASKK